MAHQPRTEKELWKRLEHDTGRKVEPALRDSLRRREHVREALNPEDEEGYDFCLEALRELLQVQKDLGGGAPTPAKGASRARGKRATSPAARRNLGILAADERRRWDTIDRLQHRLGVSNAPLEPVMVTVEHPDHSGGLPMQPATITLRLPDFVSDETVLRAWRKGREHAMGLWLHYKATLTDEPIDPLAWLGPRVKLKARSLARFRYVERRTTAAPGGRPGWGTLAKGWERKRKRKDLEKDERGADRRHVRSDYNRVYRILTGWDPRVLEPEQTGSRRSTRNPRKTSKRSTAPRRRARG